MTLKLFACGDVVNFTSNKEFLDKGLRNIVQSSDFSICNFEAPVCHDAMKPIHKAGPSLYQSKESVEYLRDAGFNLVSLANNHIYDFGQVALEETIKELVKFGIGFVGGGVTFEMAYDAKILDKNGVTVAILAACENEFGCLYERRERGGYAWLFHPNLDDSIVRLKKDVQFVVLIAHAGVEDLDFPLKEWRDRYKRLCDLGVDVVVGHHPHVPQGYEKYNSSYIFYSLGNFYFDTKFFKDKPDDSYSVLLEFHRNGGIDFDLIFHKKVNGVTTLVEKNDVNFQIEKLNKYLNADYEESYNRACLQKFHEYYYGYYYSALGMPKPYASLATKVKWVIKKVLFFKKDKKSQNLLLLHNIRIDTHRFLVQRALSLLSEEM